MPANICLIYTGGTMGSVPSENGTLAPASVERFEARVRELAGEDGWGASLVVAAVEGDPIDSADANPEAWGRVREALRVRWREFDGFVVVHGTDTLPYVAAFLSYAIEFQDKPVVVTGSMAPIFEKGSDAPLNLQASVRVAAEVPSSEVPNDQVLICFGRKILRGNRATKLGLAATGFRTPRVIELGEFSSRDGVVVHEWNEAAAQAYVRAPGRVLFRRVVHSNVALLKLFPGLTGDMVRHFAAGLDGLVVEAYGSGTGPKDVRDALAELAEGGLVVVVTTEVLYGDVKAGVYDTDFVRNGDGWLLSGRTMLAESALAKLYYFLGIARRQHRGGDYELSDDGIEFAREQVTKSVRGDY